MVLIDKCEFDNELSPETQITDQRSDSSDPHEYALNAGTIDSI